MPITLKTEDEQFIRSRAKELGYQDVSEFLADLAAHERRLATGRGSKAVTPHSDQDWAWDWIHKVAGSASGGMSTDEVMHMTRGKR